MRKIFLFASIGLSACVTVVDKPGKVPAATRVYTMRVAKEVLLNLSANQSFYCSVNYDGIKLKKDKVTLLGYIYTTGDPIMKDVELDSLDQFTRFSLDKRFGNYFITKEKVEEVIKKIPADKLREITHFLLLPVVSEFTHYISYDVVPDRIVVSEGPASKVLFRLDPSPPARANFHSN
ncbi:MAG: hypothetical protein EOO14_01005 [Chitinophagaceae bacterium]|nr:MAG: hypothetical protein EOO14_01005 [Chitinophagaceae bacterium]